MSILVNDLIADALMRCGELGIGETPDAALFQHTLRRLNRLMNAWKNDKLLLMGVSNQTCALIASTASYPQASLSPATRPDAIEYIYVTLSGGTVDYPVEQISASDYASIHLKTTPGIPRKCYVDAGNTYTLYFYPVPYANMTATIGASGPLNGGFAAGDTITFPPGYDRMLVENLAVEMCASVGRDVPRALQMSADKAMKDVRMSNTEPRLLTVNLPTGSGSKRVTYDIRGDQ